LEDLNCRNFLQLLTSNCVMRQIMVCIFVLASANAQTSRNQRLQQDLDYFATQLPALHVNAFHSITQQQFNQAVANLSASIPNLSDQQFYVGMAQFVAMIGDAHTNLFLINDEVFHSQAAAQLGFLSFPLRLRWLDDGVFVEAAAPQYTQTLGTQLVKLGSTSVGDAVAALAPVISHENDQWLHWTAQHYLTSQQVLQALGILPAGTSSQLTFQKRSGEQFVVTMSGAAPQTLVSYFDQTSGFTPDFVQSRNLNYWYAYLASTRTVYFKYNACADMASLPFAQFAQNVLTTLDQNAVDTFVFDFRGNTGGDGNLFAPLVLGLESRLGRLLANPNFQVYAAIDQGTFSSGMDDAAAFKQTVPGVDTSKFIHLIGEPTGGKPGSYGEVKAFLLPNSGLAVNYSTVLHPLPDNVPDAPSLMPDIVVPAKSADFFARHDPALAAIFSRATIPPASSGDVITVSGASFRAEQGLAPGSIAAAFGTFPNGADELQVNGKQAQLFGASTSAVIFLVPDSTALGPATVSVRLKGTEVAHGSATITATSPGIFILDGFDPSQPGAVENPDYSVNNQNAPAHAGGFLQIYGTGMSSSPSVYLGDIAVDVLFSGSVAPGLWLVDAKIPDSFPYKGQIPLAIAAGGIVSNGATVWIQ
jgi:uncharacterized protein (TIGR03437 family)